MTPAMMIVLDMFDDEVVSKKNIFVIPAENRTYTIDYVSTIYAIEA